MPLLQRYFSSQTRTPLLLSLAALSLLALLTQSLQTLDLIVENRQSGGTFLYITLLALPQLVSIILPLATFMAALYALNRLSGDSELIVARASGFSPWQISSPLIRLGVGAMIIHLLINLYVQPLSFRQMRGEILKVRTDIASQMVRAGEFLTPTPGLTVYARDIGQQGQLLDVLIHDERDPNGAITHTAESGRVQRTDNSASLILRDGAVQQVLEDGSLDVLQFDNYQVDLSDIMAMDNVLRLKSSDRFLHELLRPDPREYLPPNVRRDLAAEGHARLSAPLYNIALVLLAAIFMLRGQHLRMGYGRRIALCAAIGFGLRLSGFGVAGAAEGTPAFNIVQYLIPVTTILVCALILLINPRQRVSA